jgi:hypothetical protein
MKKEEEMVASIYICTLPNHTTHSINHGRKKNPKLDSQLDHATNKRPTW